jgi:hypothetical protein
MPIQCTRTVLARVCAAVNDESFLITCDRATCIFSSGVLLDVLATIGVEAAPMRVDALVINPTATGPAGYGVSLGSDGDGTRRPAAQHGMWRGHLTVVAEGAYLLDPTLDQVNEDRPDLGATPMVVPVTPAWLRGEGSVRVPTGVLGAQVRYSAFPGRGGFKSAPDFRPSRRRATVAAVLRRVQGG